MLINAVPQRQGAISARSGELPSGCLALAELAGRVLGEPVDEVPQQLGVSSTVDGIANRELLLANRTAQLAALEAPGTKVLTIGGDCGVELVPIGVARYRYGAGLSVAWFDAHPDLNTAATSPSGAFHGMVLRSLLGDGDPDFAASPALDPARVVLKGARVFDPAERELAARLGARLDGPVYLHLDLDVLDPAEFDGLNFPEPGGFTIARLVDEIRALSAYEVIGAGITECVGTELASLEPVIEAVGELLR